MPIKHKRSFYVSLSLLALLLILALVEAGSKGRAGFWSGILGSFIGFLILKKLLFKNKNESNQILEVGNKRSFASIKSFFIRYRLIFIVATLLIFVFYWFELRPMQTKKYCYNLSQARQVNVSGSVYDRFLQSKKEGFPITNEESVYLSCLREKGFK